MIRPAPALDPRNAVPSPERPKKTRPRLGFAGVGWIGRDRLEALAGSDLIEVAAIADPAAQLAGDVAAAHGARHCRDFHSLLAADLDGIVIATPSALHATQAIAALQSGKAVFCQKPLGRNTVETAAVVDAARRANRLLGIDFSYRQTRAMKAIHRLIHSGELGEIRHVEATFHNAYGPDKDWFYNRELSGGGCLLDLGIHLIDLALWTLDFPRVTDASGLLRRHGRPLEPDTRAVEDHASGLIAFDSGATFQLACSWGASAGCEARIEMNFYGSQGGASFRNLGGSFYDFTAEHFLKDRSRRTLIEPPDAWGGRAALEWARQLQESPAFDREVSHAVETARTLDLLYGRCS